MKKNHTLISQHNKRQEASRYSRSHINIKKILRKVNKRSRKVNFIKWQQTSWEADAAADQCVHLFQELDNPSAHYIPGDVEGDVLAPVVAAEHRDGQKVIRLGDSPGRGVNPAEDLFHYKGKHPLDVFYSVDFRSSPSKKRMNRITLSVRLSKWAFITVCSFRIKKAGKRSIYILQVRKVVYWQKSQKGLRQNHAVFPRSRIRISVNNVLNKNFLG